MSRLPCTKSERVDSRTLSTGGRRKEGLTPGTGRTTSQSNGLNVAQTQGKVGTLIASRPSKERNQQESLTHARLSFFFPTA